MLQSAQVLLDLCELHRPVSGRCCLFGELFVLPLCSVVLVSCGPSRPVVQSLVVGLMLLHPVLLVLPLLQSRQLLLLEQVFGTSVEAFELVCGCSVVLLVRLWNQRGFVIGFADVVVCFGKLVSWCRHVCFVVFLSAVALVCMGLFVLLPPAVLYQFLLPVSEIQSEVDSGCRECSAELVLEVVVVLNQVPAGLIHQIRHWDLGGNHHCLVDSQDLREVVVVVHHQGCRSWDCQRPLSKPWGAEYLGPTAQIHVPTSSDGGQLWWCWCQLEAKTTSCQDLSQAIWPNDSHLSSFHFELSNASKQRWTPLAHQSLVQDELYEVGLFGESCHRSWMLDVVVPHISSFPFVVELEPWWCQRPEHVHLTASWNQCEELFQELPQREVFPSSKRRSSLKKPPHWLPLSCRPHRWCLLHQSPSQQLLSW